MSQMGRTYESLRADIEKIPVIDTHEHQHGHEVQPLHGEPIAAMLLGYVRSDVESAAGAQAAALLGDESVSTEKKWPVFQQVWSKMQFTGYARMTKLVLRHEYGIEKITLEALQGLAGRMLDLRDPARLDAAMERYGIRCALANVLPRQRDNMLAGDFAPHERFRVLIRLPELHAVRDLGAAQKVAGWMGRRVTSLDEYVDVVREYCAAMKERGAVGMKDQSAYTRVIRYDSATRAQAEELFAVLLDDPRNSLGWPQAKPLDDYLFHELMRIARDLDLPVQVHTGHMAGIRNDVAKASASHFRSVLELHQDVRFDLFHGNWPHVADWLFLGKNYPNVSLDCCWLHIIDPRGARRVLADSLVTVPHNKIFGFGGDVHWMEGAAAHLHIARDNIASALAGMVDEDWLGMDDARQVAADWLHNNPNEFFRLGFEPVRM